MHCKTPYVRGGYILSSLVGQWLVGDDTTTLRILQAERNRAHVFVVLILWERRFY